MRVTKFYSNSMVKLIGMAAGISHVNDSSIHCEEGPEGDGIQQSDMEDFEFMLVVIDEDKEDGEPEIVWDSAKGK